MVNLDAYSVEMVRADTREPFKEHVSKSGQVYVEVEPDVEYFIRLLHTHAEHRMIRADLSLDGQSLGYCTNLIRYKEELHGIWSIQGNFQINKALKFTVQDSVVSNPKSKKRWMGKLEVTFTKPIPMGSRRTKDARSQWTGGKADGTISENVLKVVKSTVGKLALVSAHPRRKKRTAAGDELACIKLHYCTAFGLIQAGILPKPPLWDFHRKQYPSDIFSHEKMTASMIRCLHVKPSSKVLTPANKELGLEEQRALVFDLVEADMSDESVHNKKMPAKQIQHDEDLKIAAKDSQSPTKEDGGNCRAKRKLDFASTPPSSRGKRPRLS